MSRRSRTMFRLAALPVTALPAAPLIKDCPLNIECRLTQTVDLPTKTFFIGEIVNIHREERFLENGRPDVKKVRPFLLTMPDNRFWAVGEQVGNAWKDGVTYVLATSL